MKLSIKKYKEKIHNRIWDIAFSCAYHKDKPSKEWVTEQERLIMYYINRILKIQITK